MKIIKEFIIADSDISIIYRLIKSGIKKEGLCIEISDTVSSERLVDIPLSEAEAISFILKLYSSATRPPFVRDIFEDYYL